MGKCDIDEKELLQKKLGDLIVARQGKQQQMERAKQLKEEKKEEKEPSPRKVKDTTVAECAKAAFDDITKNLRSENNAKSADTVMVSSEEELKEKRKMHKMKKKKKKRKKRQEKNDEKWRETAAALKSELEKTETAHKAQKYELESKLAKREKALQFMNDKIDEFMTFKMESIEAHEELDEELKGLRAEKEKLKDDESALRKEMKLEKKIKEIALKALTEIVKM